MRLTNVFFSLLLGLSFAPLASADDTLGDKVQESAEDAAKNTKKAYRGMRDKTCEMVNGKMKCIEQKAINKAKNAKDEVKDKVNDVEKKID